MTPGPPGGAAPRDAAAGRHGLARRSVRVEVPATSANLGAGFDALALALDIVNIVDVAPLDRTAQPRVVVEVSGEGEGRLPTDHSNRFVAVLEEALREAGLPDPAGGWRVAMRNAIPVARGLGSSAAATVAALVAADALLGGGALSADRMLELAAEAEGHADNAAAAILGGLAVVGQVDGRPRALRVEPPAALHVALFIPDRPLATARMRAALPSSVPFGDAVHNVGAAALAVAAMSRGRLDLLGAATVDRLHEPYRAAVYPELPRLVGAARAAGALGACLSGAGSTIIAFCDGEDQARLVARAMEREAATLRLSGRGMTCGTRAAGARTIDDPTPPEGPGPLS